MLTSRVSMVQNRMLERLLDFFRTWRRRLTRPTGPPATTGPSGLARYTVSAKGEPPACTTGRQVILQHQPRENPQPVPLAGRLYCSISQGRTPSLYHWTAGYTAQGRTPSLYHWPAGYTAASTKGEPPACTTGRQVILQHQPRENPQPVPLDGRLYCSISQGRTPSLYHWTAGYTAASAKGEPPACTTGRQVILHKGEPPACTTGRQVILHKGEPPACTTGRQVILQHQPRENPQPVPLDGRLYWTAGYTAQGRTPSLYHWTNISSKLQIRPSAVADSVQHGDTPTRFHDFTRHDLFDGRWRGSRRWIYSERNSCDGDRYHEYGRHSRSDPTGKDLHHTIPDSKSPRSKQLGLLDIQPSPNPGLLLQPPNFKFKYTNSR